MKTPVELLIFDLDGTLADTRQDIADAVNHALRKLGYPPLALAEIICNVGDGVGKLLERSLPTGRQKQVTEAVNLFRQHYRDHLLDHTSLYPGVAEVLRHFRDNKMAVVSNKPEEFTREIVAGLGIADTLDFVLGGDSLAELKPSPEPVLHVLQELATAPAAAVMIGDGLTDIHAGQAAGTLTCGVTYGFRSREELTDAKPDLMIDDITQLMGVLSPSQKND